MRDRTRDHLRRACGSVGVVLALAFLIGCAGTREPAPLPPETGVAVDAARTAPPTTALAESRPTRLLIPAIAVDTGLMDLGLNPDGSLQVPPDGSTAGWYAGAPSPGEIGPAVLAAHVDWKGERGVFYDLREMKPGDEVVVERADGSVALFVVRSVEQHPKDQFPTKAVYGDVDGPELRLITCGGDFDDEARSYRDNIVVFAEMVGSSRR